MNIKEKIKAVVMGHAVADAVGVPAEFRSRESLEDNPITDMIGHGTYNVPKGSWSDDTSMSIATLDSLKKGKIDYTEIMDNFAKWCFEAEYTPFGDAFDMGGICYAAISKYRKSIETNPLMCGMSEDMSNGNGSLMRIHPFCLYLYTLDADVYEKLDVIRDASALTHAHERSKVACGIYSFILWELLDAPEINSVKRGLEKAKACFADSPEAYIYARLFDEIADLTVDEIRSSGYVVDTLEAAIWCILTTKDYKSCVLKAVNLGKDTDTVAAIAGGLAGALYGYDAIPGEWLSSLLRRDYLEEMCDAAADVWSNG